MRLDCGGFIAMEEQQRHPRDRIVLARRHRWVDRPRPGQGAFSQDDVREGLIIVALAVGRWVDGVHRVRPQAETGRGHVEGPFGRVRLAYRIGGAQLGDLAQVEALLDFYFVGSGLQARLVEVVKFNFARFEFLTHYNPSVLKPRRS